VDYGRALRIVRALADLQQKDVAKLAGLAPSYISLIEKGSRRPSLGTLERISKALGIPSDLLVLLATEPNKLKTRDPRALQQAAEYLVRLLIGVDETAKPRTSRPTRKGNG
jgi:transcriptional regulator with XRE-family HTH domain